nr:hypothetical protein BaRGS_009344 [Batillaria attramentaria]
MSLNISNGSLHTIAEAGFQFTRDLTEVDMRGNPLRDFPVHLMRNLSQLSVVFGDNYRLCCNDTLPRHLDPSNCLAPGDVISTCDDLLHSDVLRGMVWAMSLLAIAGNSGCLLYRSLTRRSAFRSPFNTFVTNLNLSDFLMGVYLALIGAADLTYRGTYSSNERRWTSSMTCRSAGFLSVSSSRQSALVVGFITLDRFLALHVPSSKVQFTMLSTSVACGIAWTINIIVAMVPLLPVTSEWELYSQSGICIPLPITRTSEGRDYAFAMMVALNIVLFSLIALGQAFIFWSIGSTTSSLAVTDTSRRSLDLNMARRVATIVTCNLLTWTFVGFANTMSFAGLPVPDEVHAVMSVLLFPLSSALNPWLYLLSLVIEKRREGDRQRLMKRLEKRLMSQKTVLDTASVSTSSKAP